MDYSNCDYCVKIDNVCSCEDGTLSKSLARQVMENRKTIRRMMNECGMAITPTLSRDNEGCKING